MIVVAAAFEPSWTCAADPTESSYIFTRHAEERTIRFQSADAGYDVRPTSAQDFVSPVPSVNPLEPRVAMNTPRLALAPHGYQSGYPGDVTSEGAPLGGAPQAVEPYLGQPIFESLPFYEPGGPEAVVMPDGVVIHEAGDPIVAPGGGLPGAKNGPLQRVEVQQTYLPSLGDSDGLDVLDLENSFTIGLPFPDRDSPLLITPGFDLHFLSGPVTPDLPAHLYDTYLGVRWLRRVSDKILLNSSVSPGWFSDWESNSTDALRAPAQSLIIYDWTERTQLIAGLVYLDRVDIKFLPAIGLIYKPNDRVRFEAVVPRPRILVCTRRNRRFEDWLSVGGEFGGGQWAVERANGAKDILTLVDYRAVLGWERKSLNGGIGGRLELGYVFGRKYEYHQSNTPDYEPADTVMLRSGLIY